jgi:tetratricopeptide (TPR) repeat protein
MRALAILVRTLLCTSALCVAVRGQMCAAGGVELEASIKAFREQRYEDAVDGFRRSVAQNPASALARYYLAASLFHVNKYPESLFHMRTSIRSNASLDGPGTRHYLGLCLFHMKLYLQAKKELKETLRLDPKSKLREKIAERISQIDALYERPVSAGTKRWYYREGSTAHGNGNYTLAAEYLEELCLLDRSFENTVELLVSCYNHLALYEDAMRAAGDSTDPGVLYQAGYACFQAGKYERAADAMEQIWKKRGTSRAAYYAGRAHARRGDLARAEPLLKSAISKDSSLEPSCDIELGIAFSKKGDRDRALAYLRRAARSRKNATIAKKARRLADEIEHTRTED